MAMLCVRATWPALLLPAVAASLGGCTPSMSYLSADGAATRPVIPMTWGFIAISSIVTIAIAGLLLASIVRQRPSRQPADVIQREGNGLRWIYVGTLSSTVVLFAMAIWMVSVTASVITPQKATAFTLQVIGHQWWWELRYLDPMTQDVIVAANEIHIPQGEPVKLELMSADVIHSFWIPKLIGKMDLVPGQMNTTWIEGSKPGVYRGQCAEFCGSQHANMNLLLVVDSEADFKAWRDRQKRAASPDGLAQHPGGATFVRSCGRCHTVQGTAAAGKLGPDLTHLMSRQKIGSNMYPNRRGYLAGWIADAPTLKPSARMPRMADKLSGQELLDVLDYVETLR